MVRPKEIVESIVLVLQSSDGLPDEANYVGYEPDIDSESIKLPLVEVSMGQMLEIDETNSDFVGVRTDSNGNDIGRIYETLYTQDIEISVWTAQDSKYSPRDLSDAVRDAMYSYTIAGPNKTLPHPDLGTLDEVWRVDIISGGHTDDLGTSPTLRRWRQVIEISASEQYLTDADEPPVEAINARLEYDDANSSFEEAFTVQ
jgi:hypothetical protein